MPCRISRSSVGEHFGGIYSNALSLRAALEDARTRHVEAIFCLILCSHTGIKWHRALGEDKHLVNVSVIGKPENDGRTNVWYAILTAEDQLQVEFVPVHDDYTTLAHQMTQQRLAAEFVETIRTGWWTTCMEILPARERVRSKY